MESRLYVQPFINNQTHVVLCADGDEWYCAPFDDVQRVKELAPRLGNGLEIRASLIPNAGLGVFANRAYARDEIVTWYEGRLMAWDEFQRAERHDARYHEYARPLIHGRWMLVGNQTDDGAWITDPRTQRLGLGAFINDGFPHTNVTFTTLDTNENWRRFLHRAEKLPSETIVAITALRDIAEGEELLLDYGARARQLMGIEEEEEEESVLDPSESEESDT